MRNIFGLAALSALLVGCNGVISMLHGEPQVKGSGRLKTEARQVGAFTKIETNGAADCEVTVGPATSVKVSGDDNILPLVKTRVARETLIVETKGSYSTHHPVKVTITTPKLAGYSIDGSGNGAIRGVRGTAFAAAISGSGSIDAEGQTDSLSASIDGSGNLNLASLKAKDATASISGSGGIDLYATSRLTAQISGSGSIVYGGKPKSVQKAISGSGSVSPK